MVTGVAILFLIMASVWVVISSRGWEKLYTLIPTSLALIFLYWWLLINELLEEIHEDKKADFAAASDFEAGFSIGLTTTGAAAAASEIVFQPTPTATTNFTNGKVS